MSKRDQGNEIPPPPLRDVSFSPFFSFLFFFSSPGSTASFLSSFLPSFLVHNLPTPIAPRFKRGRAGFRTPQQTSLQVFHELELGKVYRLGDRAMRGAMSPHCAPLLSTPCSRKLISWELNLLTTWKSNFAPPSLSAATWLITPMLITPTKTGSFQVRMMGRGKRRTATYFLFSPSSPPRCLITVRDSVFASLHCRGAQRLSKINSLNWRKLIYSREVYRQPKMSCLLWGASWLIWWLNVLPI